MSESPEVARANALREKGDGDLMSLYIHLRDQIDADTKAFNQKKARAVGLLQQIEAILMERLDERHTTSTSSDEAVAFSEDVTFCSVSDWDAALAFVLDTGQYQFLNHAINKNAVKEYIDEHEEPPPGVKWTAEKSLKIRRK